MSQEHLNPILEKRTYEVASTLESIQAELIKRGYDWDLPSACHQALHDWYLHNRKRDIGSNGGLPATTVEISEVQYHIHGIPHYEQTTQTVRKYIRKELEIYAELGHTVLIEQGLVEFIFRAYIEGTDIPLTFVNFPVVEMDDVDWAKVVNPEVVKRYIERTKNAPMNDGSMESGCDICSRIQADTADTSERFLRDPTGLADLQNLCFSTLLPEQLNREYLELFYSDDALMISGRSRRIAEFAYEYRTQSQEIDIIVGAGHQPGIPYYLRKEGHSPKPPLKS